MLMLVQLLKLLDYYLLVTLASFPSEMIRTTANIARQGLSELRHSRPTRGSNIAPMVFDIEANAFVKNDNPMYATGIKRLAGATTDQLFQQQLLKE